jgi:CSLREA domain-containing protein
MWSRVAIVVLAVVLVLGIGPSAPQPATSVGAGSSRPSRTAYSFVVTTADDAHDASPGDGQCATAAHQCSLRAAIEEANALNGDISVTVPVNTYRLSLGPLRVQAHSHLSVKGGHSLHPAINEPFQAAVISAMSRDRALVLAAGDVTLTDLLIGGGRGGRGGAIQNARQAKLRLFDVDLEGNVGTNGGAIANDGMLSIEDSTLDGNPIPFRLGGRTSELITSTGRVN